MVTETVTDSAGGKSGTATKSVTVSGSGSGKGHKPPKYTSTLSSDRSAVSPAGAAGPIDSTN